MQKKACSLLLKGIIGKFKTVTELIQWVWRSGVRRGEPITLYLPAPRMRRIFFDWLDDDYNIIHSQIKLPAKVHKDIFNDAMHMNTLQALDTS